MVVEDLPLKPIIIYLLCLHVACWWTYIQTRLAPDSQFFYLLMGHGFAWLYNNVLDLEVLLANRCLVECVEVAVLVV